jgi:hypothetical protein
MSPREMWFKFLKFIGLLLFNYEIFFVLYLISYWMTRLAIVLAFD